MSSWLYFSLNRCSLRSAGLATDSRSRPERYLHRPRDRSVVSTLGSTAHLEARRRRRLCRPCRLGRAADPVPSRQQPRNRGSDGCAHGQDDVDVRLRHQLSRRLRIRRRAARGAGRRRRPRVHARRRRHAAAASTSPRARCCGPSTRARCSRRRRATSAWRRLRSSTAIA